VGGPLVLAGGLAWGLLAGGLATPLVNHLAVARLSRYLNGTVSVDKITTNVFSRVEVQGLRVVSGPEEHPLPVLTAGRVSLHYSLMDLVRKGLNTPSGPRLKIDDLYLFLTRDLKGDWNFTHLFQLPSQKPSSPSQPVPPGTPPALPFEKIELTRARLSIQDQAKRFESQVTLKGSLQRESPTSVSYHLSGRTQESPADNLSLAGKASSDFKQVDATVDLSEVPVQVYVNYALAGSGFRFERGQADLHLKMRSNGKAPDLTGEARLQGADLRVPGILQPVQGINGEVQFTRDDLRFSNLSARFLGSPWTAGGGVQDLLRPRFSLYADSPNLDLTAAASSFPKGDLLGLTGTAAVSVSVTGQAEDAQVTGRLHSALASLKGVPLRDLDTAMRLDKRGVELEGARAGVWGGSVAGRGRWLFHEPSGSRGPGRLDLDFSLESVSLGDALAAVEPDLRFDGKLGGALKLSGPVNRLRGRLDLAMDQSLWAGKDYGPVALNADWAPESAKFSLHGWKESLTASGELRLGAKPVLKAGSLSLTGMDLPPLARMLQLSAKPGLASLGDFLAAHVAGQASLKARASGPLADPVVSAELSTRGGKLTFSDGAFRFKEPLDAELEARLLFEHGRVTLGSAEEPASLKLSRRGRGLVVGLQGRYAGERGLDLTATAQADLEALSVLDLVQSSEGRLLGRAVISGRLERPRVEGRVDVDGLRGRLTRYLGQVEDGSLKLSFIGHRYSLESLHFRSGGTLDAVGGLALSGSNPDGALSLSVSARTDEKGLLIENWDDMARGYVTFDPRDPLKFSLSPEQAPLLEGRIGLHDITFFYSGKGNRQAQPKAGPPAGRVPVLDLRMAAGANVWYQAGLDNGLPDISHPLDIQRTGGSVLQSVTELYTGVAFQMKLKPTSGDFSISGPADDLTLKGAIQVAGGTFTYQTNDFKINNTKDNSIQFDGIEGTTPARKRRGDVYLDADARIRLLSSRAPSSTGAPVAEPPRVIPVSAEVRPLSDECLETYGGQNVFLNFLNIKFTSPEDLNKYVAGGQPAPVSESVGPTAGEVNSGCEKEPIQSNDARIRLLLATGVLDPNQGMDVLTTSGIRLVQNYAGKFLNRGGRGLFANFFDYFRVAPHLGYTRTTLPSLASSQEVQEELQLQDLQMEMGKSLTDRLSANLTAIRFVATDVNALYGTAALVNQNYPTFGTEVGGDYALVGNGHLEVKMLYKLTPDQDPRPYTADTIHDTLDEYFGIAGSISHPSYSMSAWRQRKRAALSRPES
jgi:hypothetical protein